jgi:hypothetical protein
MGIFMLLESLLPKWERAAPPVPTSERLEITPLPVTTESVSRVQPRLSRQ